MPSFYEKFGIRKVINARGPATVLGSSRVRAPVRQDIEEALGLSMEMWELQAKASEAISRLTGAEAGCVVGCSAAGIAIAAAASLTGDDMARIKELPTIKGAKNKVVIQKGHIIGVGDAPIHQVIRMTGAEVVEIGEALDCAVYQLEASLTPDVAAAVYVTYLFGDRFPPNLLSLETFIRICKQKQVPVIVDAAYGTEYRGLIAKGADLVVYSAQKWLGGATGGMICGRRDLVYACYLQENGIGRPMKVGKEGIVGVLSAIDSWLKRDSAGLLRQQTALAEQFKALMTQLPGISAEIRRAAHSPSLVLDMIVSPEAAGITAWEINLGLGQGDPVIKADDYAVRHERLTFDFTFLEPDDIAVIVERISALIEQGKLQPGNPALSQPAEPLTRMDAMFENYKKWRTRT